MVWMLKPKLIDSATATASVSISVSVWEYQQLPMHFPNVLFILCPSVPTLVIVISSVGLNIYKHLLIHRCTLKQAYHDSVYIQCTQKSYPFRNCSKVPYPPGTCCENQLALPFWPCMHAKGGAASSAANTAKAVIEMHRLRCQLHSVQGPRSG